MRTTSFLWFNAQRVTVLTGDSFSSTGDNSNAKTARISASSGEFGGRHFRSFRPGPYSVGAGLPHVLVLREEVASAPSARTNCLTQAIPSYYGSTHARS